MLKDEIAQKEFEEIKTLRTEWIPVTKKKTTKLKPHCLL